MKTLVEHLAQYAAYHRDRRNIATHLVGVPVIVAAIVVLLSRPAWPALAVADVPLSPAVVAAALACLFWLRLDVALGALMTALMLPLLAFGAWAASQPTAAWLAWGAGGFVAGWIVQFVGHAWEGRKPAFVDDAAGLLIGPLFVVAEVLFSLGWRPALFEQIEAEVGPTRRGRATAESRGY